VIKGRRRTLGAWLCFEDESGQGPKAAQRPHLGARRRLHPGGAGDRHQQQARVAGRADRDQARLPGPADLPACTTAAGPPHGAAQGLSPRPITPGSWTPPTSSSAARLVVIWDKPQFSRQRAR